MSVGLLLLILFQNKVFDFVFLLLLIFFLLEDLRNVDVLLLFYDGIGNLHIFNDFAVLL